MSYVYLGYGTTNSEGVAHLDHDADGEPIDHSYIGVGAGEIDVLASLDNPIVEGSIVSEIYEILDCLFVDFGANTNWYNGGGFTVTPSDDGKTLQVDTVSSAYYNANMTSSPSPNFDVNTCIEFDVENAGSGFSIYLRNGSDRPYKAIPTGNSHIKITTDGSKVVESICSFK